LKSARQAAVGQYLCEGLLIRVRRPFRQILRFSGCGWFPARETVHREQGLYPEPGKSYPFDQRGVTGNTGDAIMSEDPRDEAATLAEGMEAAGALIENLEQEVADLRSDLDQAAAALKAAQKEVSSRAGALEEKERARVEADSKVEDLRAEISTLKQQHSDEQLRLSNEHIIEIAEVRRKLEEQRRTDVEADSSETRVDTVKEEFRREREALEARYGEEIEALKNASEHWEEQLRSSYQEQEARHAAELESARSAAAERERALERSLSEDFERRLAEERATSDDRQTAAVQALRSAAAERELELQNVVETQQEEIVSLRDELDAARRSSEERRKEDLRRIKALAEGRENDLRKTHATRLAEAKESADNRALRARHEEETARLRREHEKRLAAEDERRKSETWALDERLREAALQRETEMRAYTARLKKLEAARLSQKSSSQEDLERVVERFGAEISDFENRIAELEGALEESEARRNELETLLGEIRADGEESSIITTGPDRAADGDPNRPLEDVEAQNILAEKNVEDLEAKLSEAREESRRNAEELQRALESLNRLSDPARRLREGIALFNESEHARTVASISKAFGLPRVHAALDDTPPGRPTLTFLWGDMAWRRYVSDPTEGVEEPRVYLTGTGEDPAEVEVSSRQPNARMDARGRLMIGVQAR
jgi:DNA repair exonuclease SbcCD ATPase subunit